MAPLNDRGEPVCDTCGDTYGGTIDQALFRGWGYWKGSASGGTQAEHVICRKCRTEERKRPLKLEQAYENEPLF